MIIGTKLYSAKVSVKVLPKLSADIVAGDGIEVKYTDYKAYKNMKYEFEEIETVDKTKTASTVDSKMPQTGENDTAKFVGIIVFSIIGLISFYKYKESCKKALE